MYDRIHGGAGVPVAEAVAIGIKIAGALETAHRGGILHRDVKPQNILVTDFGEPALADFGVAMLQSATQTTAGLFDFTTLHAAPELLEGGGTSAATDVYELASSLYQLIAGKSAFRAFEGESPASVILRILRDPVRPLSGTDVPLALSDLLIRAMSKQMDERPPTAAEFAAELADVEIAQRLAPHAVPHPRSRPARQRAGRDGDPAAGRRHPWAALDACPVAAAASGQGRPAARAAGRRARSRRAVSCRGSCRADWSSETIVDTGGWTAPPADGPRRPVPLPPADRWWSAPPAGAAPTQYQPPDWDTFVPPAPLPPAAEPAPESATDAVDETAADAVDETAADAVDEPAEPRPPTSPNRATPRPRRVPVDIDDDFFPARRPGGLEQPAPVPVAPPAGDPGPVPVWAVRQPATAPPAASPQFSPDLSLDPMSLRRKITIRAGASAVTVDERELRLRTWLRRTTIAWPDVQGFEAQVDPSGDRYDHGASSPGQLVALTTGGPVELPGTRRAMSELRHVHAMLDAYRIRAQRLANG